MISLTSPSTSFKAEYFSFERGFNIFIIENINVNDLNLELYSSHNIFILENNDLEDRKNAFDSMNTEIFTKFILKYKKDEKDCNLRKRWYR